MSSASAKLEAKVRKIELLMDIYGEHNVYGECKKKADEGKLIRPVAAEESAVEGCGISANSIEIVGRDDPRCASAPLKLGSGQDPQSIYAETRWGKIGRPGSWDLTQYNGPAVCIYADERLMDRARRQLGVQKPAGADVPEKSAPMPEKENAAATPKVEVTLSKDERRARYTAVTSNEHVLARLAGLSEKDQDAVFRFIHNKIVDGVDVDRIVTMTIAEIDRIKDSALTDEMDDAADDMRKRLDDSR